jgi:hypothetical protein
MIMVIKPEFKFCEPESQSESQALETARQRRTRIRVRGGGPGGPRACAGKSSPGVPSWP